MGWKLSKTESKVIQLLNSIKMDRKAYHKAYNLRRKVTAAKAHDMKVENMLKTLTSVSSRTKEAFDNAFGDRDNKAKWLFVWDSIKFEMDLANRTNDYIKKRIPPKEPQAKQAAFHAKKLTDVFLTLKPRETYL